MRAARGVLVLGILGHPNVKIRDGGFQAGSNGRADHKHTPRRQGATF